MSSTNDGGPVLPEVHKFKRPNSDKTRLQRVPGMRLRDYFAAQAMVGLYSAGKVDGHTSDATIAKWAYSQANAMLAERDQSGVRDQLVTALKDCISVMDRELNGLAVIQPELRQARAALAAAEA